MAKLSMSKVEFQRVATSRGIMRTLRQRSSSFMFHCGRRIVEEFLMVFASALICKRLVNALSLKSTYLCKHQPNRKKAGLKVGYFFLRHSIMLVAESIVIIFVGQIQFILVITELICEVFRFIKLEFLGKFCKYFCRLAKILRIVGS